MTPASAQSLSPAQVRFQWPWENFTRSLTNCSKSTHLEKNQPYHPLSKTNTVYEIPHLISLNHLILNSPVHPLSPDIKVLSVFIRTLGFHSPLFPRFNNSHCLHLSHYLHPDNGKQALSWLSQLRVPGPSNFIMAKAILPSFSYRTYV